MGEEPNAISQKGVWSLAELPPGFKSIGTKWGYLRKIDSDGSIQCYKARLVETGFSQRDVVDYGEIYAFVPRFSTMRILLDMAAQEGWELLQWDVRAVFLNGPQLEELYINQPQGFI